MTKDDIIRMAREVGMSEGLPAEDDLPAIWTPICTAQLERFAALVAAAERERMTINSAHSCHSECQRPICVLVREAVEVERDECSHLAVLWQNFDLAAAIRARGKNV